MDDVAITAEVLQRLKALNVELAVDDFGTGYSSLAYLRRFPVDVLKVDRAFVSGLGRSGEDTAIVAAVVNLAHTLGLQAVAEGLRPRCNSMICAGSVATWPKDSWSAGPCPTRTSSSCVVT